MLKQREKAEPEDNETRFRDGWADVAPPGTGTAVPEGEEQPTEGGKEDLRSPPRVPSTSNIGAGAQGTEWPQCWLMQRHIIIKFLEIRYKEQVLEEIRGGEKENKHLTSRWTMIKMIANFSPEKWRLEAKQTSLLSVKERKYIHLEFYI